MRIHGMQEVTEVNGPGRRSALWLQGCDINGKGNPGCAGCWNPETHTPEGGRDWANIDVLEWCLQQYRDYRVEGITLSGGEPIHQIVALNNLVWLLRARAPWLSIGMYSGYSRRELERGQYLVYIEDLSIARKQEYWQQLKSKLDFAVLGRYNQQQPSFEPLVTSKNQRLYLFSDQYSRADFREQYVEMTISETGDLVQITGFPRQELQLAIS
jgi:anaerobic ribonucleoside-triphosphate reductase activating protein